MTTLQITAETPEARKFIEYALSLPFIREKKEKKAKVKEEIRPMTMEEFNADIDRAMEDYHAGRYITSAELKKQMASWS
jgi:hypothetical protein